MCCKDRRDQPKDRDIPILQSRLEGTYCASHNSIASQSEYDNKTFLLHVIESLAHPFYVVDPQDYTIKLANTAAQLGQLDANPTCYRMIHNRNTPCSSEHPCPLDLVEQTKDFVVVEHTHIHSDGETRIVEIHAHPILDSDGNVSLVIEHSLDVTEQRQTEEKLQMESRRAQLYLDKLGHDMANMLQVILGDVQILQHCISSDSEMMAESLNRIQEALGRCFELVSQAQFTQDLISAPLVNRSLERALLDCIETVAERHDDFLVQMSMDMEDSKITADKFLDTLLDNVLDNAIRHNPSDNKRVWIRAIQKKRGYKITIEDNGPGIDDDFKSVVFNPFQWDGHFGLYSSADIVEKYNGRIRVSDRVPGNPGSGTKFTIWLPTSEVICR
ncbi:MAG: PAS domain-containing protein [Candidatus Lokiarchaeota archaeon]|nr:PAS domain-containing protein [Candidatus Lokiarchaeota archaeon]